MRYGVRKKLTASAAANASQLVAAPSRNVVRVRTSMFVSKGENRQNEPQSHREHRGKKYREGSRVEDTEPNHPVFNPSSCRLCVSSLCALCDSVVRSFLLRHRATAAL